MTDMVFYFCKYEHSNHPARLRCAAPWHPSKGEELLFKVQIAGFKAPIPACAGMTRSDEERLFECTHH